MTAPNDHLSSTSNTLGTLSAPDYQFVRELLRKEIGYELGPDKSYLVDSRLAPIAASFDLAEVSQLVAGLRLGGDARLREAVVEAMTINETSFFRGGTALFDAVARRMIPALVKARAEKRRLRIWCAACATGQEPYSVLITLIDQCPELRDWRVEILGTDIADRVLDQARQGVYNQFEVQRGLPVQSLLRHFTKNGQHWRLADALRGRVEFRRHNLLDSFLVLNPPFDIIFLRNVLIYFDAAAKSDLFARLRRAIAPDGYLLLGETESVLGLTDQFGKDASHPCFFRPAGI